MEVSFGVGQEEVFDNALLCIRVVIQEERRYELASAPSVGIRGTQGGALGKIYAHFANAERVSQQNG